MNIPVPHDFFYYYVSNYNLDKADWAPETLEVRQRIFDFKSGNNQKWVENLLIKHINYKYKKKYSSLCFLCIPASNRNTNKNRWERFSQNVCSALNISNGLQYIRITQEGIPKHLSESNARENPELEIDYNFFRDKNIIVFDDVLTKGNSFNNIYSLLEGKCNVIGLTTLARTLYLETTLL